MCVCVLCLFACVCVYGVFGLVFVCCVVCVFCVCVYCVYVSQGFDRGRYALLGDSIGEEEDAVWEWVDEQAE